MGSWNTCIVCKWVRKKAEKNAQCAVQQDAEQEKARLADEQPGEWQCGEDTTDAAGQAVQTDEKKRKTMNIDVLTLFPEMFPSVVESSILGRAASNGILKLHFTDIRAFSKEIGRAHV